MQDDTQQQAAVHPGGLAEEQFKRIRAAQRRLDVPYQEANNRHLGLGTTVLYTLPNEAPNRSRFEAVPATVVKLWSDRGPVLRVLGVHHGEDFTLWTVPFTVAQPGTPEAAGAWSWATAGLPQCCCGRGCILFNTKRCTACGKSPEEMSQSTRVDSLVEEVQP